MKTFHTKRLKQIWAIRPYIGPLSIFAFVQNFLFKPYPMTISRFWGHTLGLVLAGLTVLGSVVFAQPLTLEVGASTQTKWDNSQTHILGKFRETYLVLGPVGSGEFQMVHFDKSLLPLKTVQGSFAKDQKLVHRLQESWLLEDRVIALTHCYNKAIKQDQYNLWHLSVDGEVLKGPVEVHRANGNGKSINQILRPLAGASLDGNRLYVLINTAPTFGQEISGLICRLYDTELEMVSQHILNFPVQNQAARLRSATFRDGSEALLTLDLQPVTKNNAKSATFSGGTLQLWQVSLNRNQYTQLPIASDEMPYVHGVQAFWSTTNSNMPVVSSALGLSPKTGTQSILLQKFGGKDSIPAHRHAFEIPLGFRKSAETNNRKFKDTGNPKRPLKEVMDLRMQVVELDKDRFTLHANIERSNREIPAGVSADEVAEDKVIVTQYNQGGLMVNGAWTKGLQESYEIAMDQILASKNFPRPNGVAPMVHPDHNILIYNELPANLKTRGKDFKLSGLTNENHKESRSTLLYIDPNGRYNYHQLFANPTDQGKVYPYSLYRENAHNYLLLGTDTKGKMRMLRASY